MPEAFLLPILLKMNISSNMAPSANIKMNHPENPWKNPSATFGLTASERMAVIAILRLLVKIVSGMVEITRTAFFQKAAL